jgi:hypothetical protein
MCRGTMERKSSSLKMESMCRTRITWLCERLWMTLSVLIILLIIWEICLMLYTRITWILLVCNGFHSLVQDSNVQDILLGHWWIISSGLMAIRNDLVFITWITLLWSDTGRIHRSLLRKSSSKTPFEYAHSSYQFFWFLEQFHLAVFTPWRVFLSLGADDCAAGQTTLLSKFEQGLWANSIKVVIILVTKSYSR